MALLYRQIFKIFITVSKCYEIEFAWAVSKRVNKVLVLIMQLRYIYFKMFNETYLCFKISNNHAGLMAYQTNAHHISGSMEVVID